MKTIIINNAGPRGPQGSVGAAGPSGSDANVPPLIISSSKQFTDITSPFTGSFTGSFAGDISLTGGIIIATSGSFSHIKGNSPITVQDSVTFQQPVTGSIFSGSFVGDGSGLLNVTAPGTLSGSAQIASNISGSFVAPSASFSTRVTTSETSITNLQTDSGSFSTRITANEIVTAKTLISGSDQIASNISGSFGATSASLATRITTNTSNASTNNAAFDVRITANEANISNGRALITGITSSLSTTGRMVFVGASGILTSEAGFEYNATTNQLSVDNLNVNHLTSSFITASRIFTSGSNIFGDASNDVQTLIGTTKISGSAQVTGSLNISGIITGNGSGLTNVFEGTTASSSISTRLTTQEIKTIFSGSFSGSYEGNGSGLTNIPATGIVGLNLSQIASGSATASISPNSGLVVNTNVSSSAISTASFGTYLGDGSNLSGISTTPFPFSGSAVITGSLVVSQSIVDFSNASSVVLPAATQPLINPEVRYFTTTVITGSGTTVPIPGGLTFISSSVYEYMEIFINGLRLRYDIDFIPMSTASVQYSFAVPAGSEITYKSLKRP